MSVSTDGSCLRNEDCLVQDGALTTRVNGKTVDNSTFCCTNQSDYIDMTLVAPGNVTCHCTTAAEAAAAYADRTMGEG
nr:hypothetical protein BaRGS_027505 [Batillaria attramentaria]